MTRLWPSLPPPTDVVSQLFHANAEGKQLRFVWFLWLRWKRRVDVPVDVALTLRQAL